MTKERKAKALATVPEQPETVTPEQVVPEIVPKVKRAKVVDDQPDQEPDEQPILHRTYVLITTSDLRIVQEHFAEGRPGLPLISVHPPRSRTTDKAKAYRQAYRQRPEVKAKMREYRKQRAARLRAAATAKPDAPPETAE